MEFKQTDLDYLIRTYPGDYAVYRLGSAGLSPLYTSPGLPALSEMDEEEYRAVTGENAVNIVFSGDRAAVEANLTALLAGPQNAGDVDFTYRILHKTLGFVWMNARARIIGEQDGEPVVLIIFHSSAFGAREQADLLSEAIACIYVVDRETRELLYLNEPAIRAFGHGDYAGCRCYRYVCGFDAPCPWCSLERMENGRSREDEFYMPGADRWMQVKCREMDWFGHKAVAVYSIDITEQKKRQTSLEIDKKSLETIVNNLPVGVAVCQMEEGKALTMAINPQFRDLLELRDESSGVADPALLQRIHPDDRENTLAVLGRIARPGGVRCAYRYLREGEREYRWYQMESRTIPQGEGVLVFSCVSDVTAEREAAAELRKSRQIYRAAADVAQLVLWEYDLEQKRVRMMTDSGYTRQICAVLGLPETIDNMPSSILPYFLQEDRGSFLEMYWKAAGGAAECSCDVRLPEPDSGRIGYAHISCITVRDERGKPMAVYGFGQNITGTKLAEEKYESAYRQLAEEHPFALASFHLNLTTNWCGDGKSRLDFVLKQQEKGTVDGYFEEFASLIDDEEVKKEFYSKFNRAGLLERFAAGETKVSVEYPITYPDGTRYWREGLLYMLQNPHTGDVEAVTYAVDITDKKLDRQIITRITNEEFDYIGIIDPRTGTFEFRYRRKQGVRFGQVGEKMDYAACCRTVGEESVPADKRAEFARLTALDTVLSALRENGGEYAASYERLEDGVSSRRHLQYSWLDKPEGLILVVRSDVTAAYRQEQEQLRLTREALSAAQEASRAKTEFVSRISHDIRTPISIISNMTDFALEDMGDAGKLKGDLRKIQSANTFLLSLINDVLDISKIDSGKVELAPEPYPYSEYIVNLRNMFEPLCAQKGLKLEIIDKKGEGVILADKIRINQIVLNILANAVKYTPAGGTVTYQSFNRELPDDKFLYSFEVRDTGIGMSEEFQRKMFEPFSQEYDNPGRSKAETGTGLGLSIVRRNVELMGGTIQVRSRLGEGTAIRCSIVFPNAARDPRYQETVREKTGEEPLPRTLRGKVLLAEDNRVNTEIAVRIVRSFGLEVDCAENGREAAQRFAASAPGEYRAVLMDLQMPLVNGYEAAQLIRDMPRPDARTVPIVAMTADAFSEAMERCRQVGMNAHVIKPLDPKLLRRTLEELLPQDD